MILCGAEGGDRSLFKRTKRFFKAVALAYKGAKYDFTNWFLPKSIFAGRDNHTLANNETVFSAVTRLSNSMASMPIKLFKEFKEIKNDVSVLVSDEPNQNMTSFEFIRQLEASRDTNGNGYAIKIYGLRYNIEKLVILDPQYVTPIIEATTKDLWYQIEGDKGRYFVHNADMIHVKHIYSESTYNPFKGISPLKVLSNATDFDASVREFSLSQMESAKQSFILAFATNVDKDKRQAVVDDFRRFYAENGGVLFKEPGVDIDPIKKDFIDPNLFKAENITKNRVATVYNIPTHMLGLIEGVGYNSMEQLFGEFVQGTLLPIVRQYEQEFNRKLLTPQQRQQGFYFKFNMNALLRGDMQTRGDFYTKAIRSSWMSPDDVRMLEDLPPKGGNSAKQWISGDLYPIDLPIEQRKTSSQKALPREGGD